MKIKRKPKTPRRSNPPKSPVAPSNKRIPRKVNNSPSSEDLQSERLARQWQYYSRVGDTDSSRRTKVENVYEYHKRITGKELERPIITMDEARDKTVEELEVFAEGHDMDLEGLNDKNKRTAIWLYVTGQKKMAYKMIKNRKITGRRVKNPSDKHLEA